MGAADRSGRQSGPPGHEVTMKYLYVFPHPDDESFGPALAMSAQKREGHEVHLLTLTRGGATRQREKYGYTIERMGEIRLKEMERVRDVLQLDSLEVLDWPDGGLDDVNPLKLERDITDRVAEITPDILVTYAFHGISGHPDHLVTHASVKRVYCTLRTSGMDNFLRRLAFFTLLPSEDSGLSASSPEQVDCIVPVDEQDVETARRCLECYETYQDVIEEHDPLRRIGSAVPFEIFRERFDPPLSSLTGGLRTSG